MKFICERCGKTFTTQDECILHESEHQKADIEKKEKIAKEQESLKNIDALYKTYVDAVKKHNEDFGRKYSSYPVEFIFGDPFKTWRA